MEIEIYDVEHGACALISADNGARMLIDCGHNATTKWRPSQSLPARGINRVEALVVANYDEDHVSDLPQLLTNVYVRALVRNPSVSHTNLRNMKSANGIGNGIGTLAYMVGQHYTAPVDPPLDFGLIRASYFWNVYPSFKDENNLSLVTFLEYNGIGIVFPGDMHTAGWEQLLQDPDFRLALSRVNVFVASHHGRWNGYCREVFDYCHPEIIVFSDKSIVHETQLTAAVYRPHASGIRFFDGEMRYVLTTRNNGNIRITKYGSGVGLISISKK